MLKYLFVDFDGTLFDSIESMFKAYLNLLRIYGIEGTKEEFYRLNGPSTNEVANFLYSKYSINVSFDVFLETYLKIIQNEYQCSKPFDDAENFLSSVHANGIKIVLVTSSLSQNCKPILEKLNWSKFFDYFVWGEDVANSKPSPEIYREALSISGADQESVVVIEDSLNGVKSGHNAGLKVYGVANDFSDSELLEAGATMVFQNLNSSLATILK